MVKVDCRSGTRINERPVAFTLTEGDYTRLFRIREVLDSWFGETEDYFKVAAEDDNIYLLKYDGRQDVWDLIFYQNPHRLKAVQAPEWDFRQSHRPRGSTSQQPLPLH